MHDVKIWVEGGMDQLVPKEDEYPSVIHQSIRYSLFAGGKRIRPFLVYLSQGLYSNDFNRILPVACAVEMVHTYSLIHDDLPAMDNDDLRRGKPTNHKVFGDAVATLAGDALLTMVFEVLPRKLSENKFDPRSILDFMILFARDIGIEGLVGGQVVDI
ncbi:MAG TPA: geranyl transferase, partial [Firmicutes bacterium]|nr:geranyl transferase [Bacillota bacterium]